MTERLATLLRHEADHVDVPGPDTRRILARAHSLRNRRRASLAGGAAVVLVLAGLGGGRLLTDGDRDVSVADPVSTDLGSAPVFGLGDTLYLDGGATPVRFDEVVQAIYYTSAGFLVRTNETGASDGGAPFDFTLVTPAGVADPLDLTLGEVVPSTDAGQPYLAYAELADNGSPQVVVLDVTTEEEVARVDVPEVTSWGGWTAPPVGLDGDTVYVGGNEQTVAVDWRTGETRVAEHLPGGFPAVRGGRAIAYEGRGTTVIDVATGEALVDPVKDANLVLSPDGRFALENSDSYVEKAASIWDLGTGRSTALDGPVTAYGWTPDGHPFAIDGTSLWRCVLDTGACTHESDRVPAAEGEEFPRLAGFAYES